MNKHTHTDTTKANGTEKPSRSLDQTPSGEAETAPSQPGRRKWLRIALLCLGLTVVLGIGARLALPALLVNVGNAQFAKRLTSPATLKTVRLGLLDYRVTVQGLVVRQPAGFGDDLLLDLADAKVTLGVSSFFGSPRTVDEVRIVDSTLHLVRDRDGKMNVAQLLRPAEEKPEATGAQTPVHIKRITVENLTVQYTDFALGEEPVDVTFNQIDAVITDVYLDSARSGEHSLPGRGEATAQVVQPGFSDAPLGIIVRFGYLDTDQVPALNGAIRLAGLELRPFEAVLQRGLSQAIGGDIIDVNVDLAMAPETFDCTIAVITPAGDALSEKIGGTPGQPQVEDGALRGMINDRAQEAGLNGLGNVAGTGEELGRTALSSVGAAGKGAGRAVWGVVTGLFKTGANVSRGNLPAAGGNLQDTATGAATNTADAVENMIGSLVTGAGNAASAASGGDRNQMWRADIQQRWLRSWDEALTSVAQKPFPLPVVPVSGPEDARDSAEHAALP